MADVTRINGYDVKDTTARQSVEELKQQVEGMETSQYDDSELREMIEGKADKTEIPSIEGLATEQFVREEIAKVQPENGEIDTSGLATKEELKDYVLKEELDEALSNFQPSVPEPVTEVFVDPQEEDSSFEGVDIFSIANGTVQKPEGGNAAYYRIPALTVSANNTLIAFTDVRYDSAGDQDGRISIFCRRSEDKGVNWGPAIEVCKYPINGDGSATSARARSMDSTVIASKSGKIFCLNGAWKSNTGNWSQVTSTPDPDWILKLSVSEDDGLSWTTYNLNELPDMFTGMPEDLVSMLGGVGQGIQMEDDTLVFPVQLTRRPGGVRTVYTTVIYSKDDGETWTMASGFAPASDGENNIVEMEPGVILMNARGGASRPCFTTNDLGETWESYDAMSGKIGNGSVGCQGSSTKININGKDIFLHSSPINNSGNYTRDSITLYASYDWENYDLIRTYYPKSGNASGAGYSCLAPAIIDNQLCLFAVYERQGCIAFRNLGIDLQEIVERSEHFFLAQTDGFEAKKPDLLSMLEKFTANEMLLFNMLDHYLNTMSNEERSLMGAQIVKLAGIDSNNQIIDRNGTTWQLGGNVVATNNCFYFNGSKDNWIRTNQLRLDIDYTIDFDVCVKGTTNTNWNFLFSLDNGTNKGAALAINDVDTWNPVFDNVTTNTFKDDESFIDKWIHVTVVKSSTGGAKVYTDGKLRFENKNMAASTSTYGTFTIGNDGGSNKEFNGKIANFKIYNKVVTEEEIQHLVEDTRFKGTDTEGVPEIPGGEGALDYNASPTATAVPASLKENLLVNIAGAKKSDNNAPYDAGSQKASWTFGGTAKYDLQDNAFIFDGTSTANIVKTTNFLDIDFSIDFDIYITAQAGTTWTQVFCIGPTDNTPRFALAINATNTWNPAIDGNGSKTYTEQQTSFVGRWIHITAIKSSTNGASFYHDGQLVWNSKSNGLDGTETVSGYTGLAIGNNVNPIKQFNGKIANFRIYNKVLSESEISEIYSVRKQ